MTPLNGIKTHPLSPKAKMAMDSLKRAPIPTGELNPGVVDRLLREGCCEIAMLPSPYKSVKGNVPHLRLLRGPR